MTTDFPRLDAPGLPTTRAALHAYSRLLGEWAKRCRPRRKHWWHASLRPSLDGLTTGVIYAGVDFELELDLRRSRLRVLVAGSEPVEEALEGQPAGELSAFVADVLISGGVDPQLVPDGGGGAPGPAFEGYDAVRAATLGHVLRAVAAAMTRFRAGIAEETSPIQLWPHHFDLAMLWLPGGKIEGEDPADEEASDRQMNFGFVFGDAGIAEPYFYVTAYPLPEGLTGLRLPAGSGWHTGSFTGAVLPYRRLTETEDPAAYLLHLWNTLLSAGRQRLLS